MSFQFPSRLYAILDVDCARTAGWAPLDLLIAWLAAGVRLVQLRAKTTSSGEFLALADQMAAACRTAGAIFVVNDRADIAALAGADGVHLGQEDLPPDAVRPLVGPDRLVGLSTHSDIQLDAACRQPVDYLAIGPVFATSTKLSANTSVGLDGVARAAVRAHRAGRPLVAIGGITLATAPAVLASGADAVAVISDLFVADTSRRAKEYLNLT